ncbi:sensor histidine kinase [Streptomyces spirodelae]|uniref:histidine kinase n=1 Tax=Streptomyces spirodelae TaxID=2812904 RepID=A0ABS3X3Y0_9ACTN|nr:nitrate- and nitrite sensing domain-containing protein [Streptomyces spirodelae]MBO8190092.1 nitrate- and nitrite sensing domain-containing protein [Streptomyces spirodelae]
MQGRFKRDGSAEGAPEAQGSAGGSQPQRAHEGGPAGGEQGTPSGAQVSAASGAGKGDTGKGDKQGKAGKAAKGGGAADGKDAAEGPDLGSRVALRNWRISTRLVSLLALPVIAATTLGGMRISSSLQNVDQLDNMKLLTEMTEQATDLAAKLQDERDKSAGPLVSTGNEKDESVVAPREKTDKAFQSFKKATGDIDGSDKVMAGVQSTVLDIVRQLDAINTIRERAYENPDNVSQTVNAYNQLIDSLLSLSQDMAQATSNSEMIRSTRALAAFSSAKEYASMQRAIISAGLAHQPNPKLSENDRLYARTAVDSEDAELESFSQIYGDKAHGLLKPLSGDVNVRLADNYRKRMLHSPDAIRKQRRTYVDWIDQDQSKITAMEKIERTLLEKMEQQARELRSEAQREALISGALILLVLGISLVGAFVVARSMVRSLRRLQDTAQDVARKRLPELVKQMSEAEPQDVDTSVESVGVHSRDEIGKVAAAFDDVHREAVRLAGEQALLRGNVNAMFTNLSRRSQGLIQRQLSLISELESREADPDQLSSLFKLDHLATRMRRNGENLLVLAGEEPGRRWTRPVPLVDVLRAAASEVEQYERIELNSVPTTEVAGRVVNDLVHLLAELLENATSFSSPQTKVKVTGHALPDGRVLIEIHDTGIGLSPEDLSAINERLANPPTVDVSVSRRMGLFVVGRLSLRHGIRIQLRPSDSGGTTALVMLPVDVAQGGAQNAKGRPGTGAPGGQGGPPPPQTRGGSKGGNLAAALQRGPQSGAPGVPGLGQQSGPGLGSGDSSRMGALPARGQDAGGGRPALPARDGNRTPAGSGGGSAVDFFGAPPNPGRPGQAPPGPGAGNSPLPNRAQNQPAPELPGAPTGQGPQSSTGTGQFALPQSGGPAATGEYARPGSPSEGPGSTSEIPRITPDGPADTGQYARPGAQQEGPGTGQFPQISQGSPADTGQYPRPGAPSGSGTGQFALPQSGGPAATGEYARPGSPSEGPGSTSEIPRITPDGPADTGEYAPPGAPDGPGHTGQFPQPQQGGSGDTAQFARPSFGDGPSGRPADGEQNRPSWARPEQGPGDEDAPRGHDEPEGTGEYAAPGYPGGNAALPGRGQDASGPQQGQDPGEGIPSGPPAPADAPTPIFASMESNWFRGPGRQAPQSPDRPQQATPQQAGPQQIGSQQDRPDQARGTGSEGFQRTGADGAPGRQPGASPAPRPGQPAAAVPPLPQRQWAQGPGGGTAGAGQNGAADPSWGASPNDERWRRAEQLRQPAAGGVTTSGLPRRVPRANLVAGTAQQQSSAQAGPQVSRAPDDVRGRLTNLRRGIQQGRQAGPDNRGADPTYQQER